MKKGQLSIHTENIFPIIKKFLYSNQEVFLRELVSNAVDATQKLRTLSRKGETGVEVGDTRIRVKIDSEAKTLTISDRGIGMTSEEVEKYINQIAFSSAGEFLEKFKDTDNQIIGHFGLGFYSAFMVAHKVEIFTRSYQEGAQAAHWVCDGSTEFSIEPTEKAERGTDVVLHIAPDSEDYLKSYKISDILTRYCKFLPVEIEFEDRIINKTEPLWKKQPSELKDEDYKAFFDELFPFTEPPLFWIHLNVDYPFNLTGILYFPQLKPRMELLKNRIQLYCNQVFVTDNVEDVVPDYLNLLQGVLDSPDIPLNVSRSYLQTDSNVRKISNHISKKVADKLNGLFFDDRADFEKKWTHLGTFVKYGMIRDTAFHDRAKDFCLVQNLDQDYFTLQEYKDKVAPLQTNKNNKVVVLYTTNPDEQHTYIQAARKRGYDVVVFDGVIDLHFINYIEHRWEGVELARVDADAIDKLVDKGIEKASLLNEQEEKDLLEIYKTQVKILGGLFQTQALSEDDLPLTIVRPEHQRRMSDMSQAGLMGSSSIPEFYTLVINTNHQLSRKLLLLNDEEERARLTNHAYEIALLTQNMLTGDRLADFVHRSVALLK
jgi:molecular chaperone HtpG